MFHLILKPGANNIIWPWHLGFDDKIKRCLTQGLDAKTNEVTHFFCCDECLRNIRFDYRSVRDSQSKMGNLNGFNTSIAILLVYHYYMCHIVHKKYRKWWFLKMDPQSSPWLSVLGWSNDLDENWGYPRFLETSIYVYGVSIITYITILE